MVNNPAQTRILAPNEQAHARKIRLRWLIVVSSLPFLGILTAFGIAPDTDTTHVAVQTIVENLPLSSSLSVEDNQSSTVSFWRDERIERGDTAAAVLQRLGVNNAQITLFLKNIPATHALIAVKPGKRIQAQVTGLGDLIWLRHISSNGQMLQIANQNNKLVVSNQAIKLDAHTVMKSGTIQNTLFAATDAADIPDAIATQLADIFSTNIDFHQDLKRGDRFNLIYEMLEHNGEPVMTGRILAAEFTNSGHTYRAILSDVGGKSTYYTPDGKPLKSAFLRSPVAFSRISSGFAMRYHPILKKWKQHKGIDYAAPIGTKVMAIADATVDFVGQETGYGNLIVLKHAGIYSTAYGHLSAFAKGLHRGEKVTQGEVIGYVGMSGWATGPHLHYEFRVAGVPTNPLTAKMPSALPITAALMPLFKEKTQDLIGQLALLDDVKQVAMK
jgi:murein DD-endopeptidase MepM/ murein hydrolase activator NlpD